jgi:radical SAM superfamily enzyme YgiQ (UPF0313 family)
MRVVGGAMSGEEPGKPKKAVLVGIAGSNNAFSLSLYNLKTYAYTDADIRQTWDLPVIQHPLINVTQRAEKIPKLVDQIVAQAPDLVAFSCYMWNVDVFQELSGVLRQRLPEAQIVWGGPEIATDYLLNGKYDGFEADFCVSGEGELTFLELLRNRTHGTPALAAIDGLAFRDRGRGPFTVNRRRTPFKSLLEIPSPFLSGVVDDEVLLRRKVQANIETQRGCNLRCSYCIYHKDMDRISYSGVDRILDEVAYVAGKGVKDVRFVDANFSSSLDHAKAVMRGLIERRFETKLMFELIPGFLDEELAALFAEFNALHEWNDVTLGVGVQTINLDVLRRMRRAIRVEKFEQTFDLLQKYGIYAKIDLIVGLPGEDIASIERTLEYMLDKLRGSRRHLLCCHVMRGLPGTELLEIAKQYGMVFSSRHEPHELVESPALPRADMLKCLRRTAVVFRLINHRGWADKELVSGKEARETSIRDAFFETRDRLGISHVALVDLLVQGLLRHLAGRGSWFARPDFPFAETWWWNFSALEVQNEWILDFLARLPPRHATPEPEPSLAELGRTR